MSEACILGIDPGASGAIAFYWPSSPGVIAAEDVPVVNGEIDSATLAQRLTMMKPELAIIELVGARPGQGVSSMFKFGTAYGVVRGVVSALGIPTHLVTPGKWKKHYRLSSEKEEARSLALRSWPTSPSFSRKKDHGRAEAALLARYGAEVVRAI